MIDFPAAPSYPWLLGTTSFVLPAGLEENVRALAGRVDAVQLLFFESKANSRLDHRLDVGLLAQLASDHGLTYTVHLPLDLHLGSGNRVKRQDGIDEVCRLLDELAPLKASAFDLHLDLDDTIELAAWQANVCASLDSLAGKCGPWQEKIGVENIGYDFSLAADIVHNSGFGICVDFGHRLRYNQDTDFWALPNWRHIHLHGASAGKDHRPFQSEDRRFLEKLGEKLTKSDYRGVITLELYDAMKVRDSLAVLHEVWQPFQQGGSV